MPTAGFESAVPKSERPQAHTFDRATAGLDEIRNYFFYLHEDVSRH